MGVHSVPKPPVDDGGDPGASLSVAERKGRPGHCQTLERILEEMPDLSEDTLSRGADQPGIAANDTFRPFRLLAQDEQRSGQRRRLFLDPAGVA